MDPIMALGVAGTSARLATTAWNTGEILSTFIKNAKTVDQTLIALAAQSHAVEGLCELIAAVLQERKQRLGACPDPTCTRNGKQLGNVLHLIEGQLTECEETLQRLCRSTQGIRFGNRRLAEKTWAQLKLNLSKELMVETRSQLSLHLLALNTSLQIWNINLTALDPGHLVNDVKHETDARHAHVPLPDPPQSISHKISPQQTLLSQVKEAFAHGLSFYGSALTSELDIRSELSKTSTSLELTIRSHRTKGRQWSRDCSLDSSARLSATSTDVEKAGLLDKPEDVDLLRQVNFAALENALDGSVAKYRAEHYHDARLGFLNVISKVHNLPPSLRGYYNTFGIAYMHAVAAYHSTDYINARHVLMDFVSKQARTRTQKLCLAHASSLLAFVSIELGELQAARVACTQAVQCCYGMDSRSAKALDDYLALSARVETLLGNHARAKELICGTEPGRQDLLTRLCSRSPHRQSLSLEERCAIARSETDLFAKAEFCEHTGKVTALASQGHNCGGRLFMRSLGRRSKPQNIGITSLHFAVLFGDAEEASALIDNGADVDAQANVATFRHLQWSTEHPFTPLACALLLRHANLVRLLVSKGAKLTNPGGTSVVLAIMNEKFVRDDSHSFREILDTLKLLGWDINSPSGPKGRTLLHNAVRSSNSKHARILVSCGASVTTKDLHGNIPLNIAIARWRHESRVPEMISTLLRHHKQEQLTSRNHSGMTPLHVVTHSDHLLERAALFLLKAGADPHAIDDLGRIPYNWLQKRWDWTGVSRFLTNSRSEMPSVASFDSPGMMAEHTEAAGRFLDAIT